MNRVLFRAEELPLPCWTLAADSFAQKVLDFLGLDNCELSVLFCNNRYIKSLNAQYRNKDEPTDVLSFPLGDILPNSHKRPHRFGRVYLLGDIVISLDALEENARFFKVSRDEELRRLFVHSILHLFGYDHATNEEEEPMLKTQEEIMSALADMRIQENDS